MPRARHGPICPAGSHRSPGETDSPPVPPDAWPPPSARPCPRSLARPAFGPRHRAAWDLHRPDLRRQVGPRAHSIPDLVEVVPQIGLELLQIHLVHSRRSMVGLDPPPRLADDRPGDRKRLLFRPWHVASPPPRTNDPG